MVQVLSKYRYHVLLALLSAIIYAIYFPQAIFHPNEVLAGITGDALKNYYTYAFHATKDTQLLHFEGMQFPYGEHIVYTDCQPLLSTGLQFFPFLHKYVIGILHLLLFLSHIVSAPILFSLLRKFELKTFLAFCSAIAIAVLSPLFQKISGGHHGLAYGCAIPLTLLMVVSAIQQPHYKQVVKLALYNIALFFIHPYMGFASAILSCFALAVYFLLIRSFSIKYFVFVGVAGILPIAAFKIFMLLSDQHPFRTSEPFGNRTLLENIDGLLAPDFGPFQSSLEKLFNHKIAHLESHAYLGVFSCLLFIVLLFKPKSFLKYANDKTLLSLLIAALLLLFMSFGWHQKALSFARVQSTSINQFRAACRFAWSFYYVWPIFLVIVFSRSFSAIKHGKLLVSIVAVLYVTFNLIEAHGYFTKDKNNFWKFRNILSEDLLLQGERKFCDSIRSNNCQAIVALPVFHLGSETYARSGADLSMIPAMMYSYHCKLPILGAAMSRCSISETEKTLDLLNAYKTQHEAAKLLSGKKFAILLTNDALAPDEKRLLYAFNPVLSTDSVQLGFISQTAFLSTKTNACVIKHTAGDSIQGPVFTEIGNGKAPYVSCIRENYYNAFVLDSAAVNDGTYVVSYHYYAEGELPGHLPDLIVARRDEQGYRWESRFNGRTVSGFYEDYQVAEFEVNLSHNAGYEFVLIGGGSTTYHISNFMLRPEYCDVVEYKHNKKYINNFALADP